MIAHRLSTVMAADRIIGRTLSLSSNTSPDPGPYYDMLQPPVVTLIALSIVLGEGKVVEEGTHLELLRKPNGIYADLWHQQQEQEGV